MNFLFPNELSVRTEASGGDVAPRVEHGPGGGPDGRTRVILLIHGYDNSIESARDAYKNFRNNFQTELATQAGAKSVLADMYEFFWPGDKAWPPLLHYLSYPLEIKLAVESGKSLARFLATLSGPGGVQVSVLLIAHSLGNRVLLEMLNELANQLQTQPNGVEIAGICLMAAAVPVSKVESGGKLHRVSTAARSCVLSSVDDTVLHYAFPPGETASGDAFWPTAVGRYGQPEGQWGTSKPMPGYKHGDYWKKKETIDPVARFLGQTVPNRLSANSLRTNSIADAVFATNSIRPK